MAGQNLQIHLFNEIKGKIPPESSLVGEIADLLSVSTDSAYRRIRGETELTLHEAGLICERFQLSLDDVLNLSVNSVTFFNGVVREQTSGFNQHFEQLLMTARMIAAAKEKRVTYIARELPVFHLFHMPSLISFKTYFWRKIVAGLPEMDNLLFSVTNEDEGLEKISREILIAYTRVPTVEILSEDALVSTFNQIEFCLESGYFSDPDDALRLFDDLAKLVEHMKKQAELGFKFLFGGNPLGEEGNFQLFHNEIIQSENMVFAEADGTEAVFLEHNVLNFLRTNNPEFCSGTRAMLERIKTKSPLISSYAERERNKFFNKIQVGLRRRRGKLENLVY